MLEYITTKNFGRANSIVARMDILMGYPNSPTKTDTYTIPQEHASNAGEYLVIIKEVWSPKLGRQATVVDINGELNPAERNTIKTQEQLEAEGAFLTEVI